MARWHVSNQRFSGRQVDEPYDGGHGIGIDTATIHQIDSLHEEGWD